MDKSMENSMDKRASFSYRIFIATFVVLLTVAMALFLWQARNILLLTFAGLLLAVALKTMTNGLQRLFSGLFRLPYGLALASVVVLLLASSILGSLLILPSLAEQFDELWAQTAIAFENLEETLSDTALGRGILEEMEDEESGRAFTLPGEGVLLQMSATFLLTFNALADTIFVMFIGLFLASSPQRYRDGLVRLAPVPSRKRAFDLIHILVDTLRKWLLGTLISMAVVGTVVGLGLWALGISLALPLGILVGLLEFIPIIGPILGTVPVVLVSFVDGPWRAFYVLIFYLIVQQLEGNILTPLVQQYTVELPPVLTLLAVLTFGHFFGMLGYILATPLAAVSLVLIRTLYIRDTLGDEASTEAIG